VFSLVQSLVNSLLAFLVLLDLLNFLNIVVLIMLSVAYSSFVMLRKKLLIMTFKKVSHLGLLWLHKLMRCILWVLALSLLIAVADVQLGLGILPNTVNPVVCLFSFIFLFLPIRSMFRLTQLGITKIAFEQLYSNINDFSRRQRWFKETFKKLESILREGNIKVSHNDLLYYANLKLMQSPNPEFTIKKIEDWILSKRRDDTIFNTIRTFLPATKIQPVEKASLTTQLSRIPTERILHIFYICILFYVFVFIREPEKILEFVKQILAS